MISHHAHANVVIGIVMVVAPGHLFDGLDDGVNLVNFVHIRLVLQDECEAFETCTRVNGLVIEFA